MSLNILDPLTDDGQTSFSASFLSASKLSLNALVASGTSAKAELELTPKYGALLDKYIHASAAEQWLLAVFYTLKTAEQLEKVTKAEKYTIPENLKSAMHKIGHEGIPQSHEIGKLDIVHRALGNHLTQDRYNIKKRLDESLKSNSPTRNIALLACNICKCHFHVLTFSNTHCITPPDPTWTNLITKPTMVIMVSSVDT
ncbi:hypothetical protein C8R42DRAFT_648468 [Lentinula raphanica]|nr:hypothetical protein C8R42DRAFT_648468 [Lentinula raphanica]